MQQLLSSYTDLESLGYIKSDQVSSCTILSLIIVTNSEFQSQVLETIKLKSHDSKRVVIVSNYEELKLMSL